jgi:hypothetical protein
MMSVDIVLATSHPYLACPPRAETTADGLGWLLYDRCMLGGIKATMGRRRPPWLRSALAAHFVSVCCVVWIVIIVAEYRLQSNIIDNMF